MIPLWRYLLFLAYGVAVVVGPATLAAVLPVDVPMPQLTIPLLIGLGVAPEVHLVFGVVVAFSLGYLLDVASGYSLGLQTFLAVATFLGARGAGLRFFPRGPLFQVLVTFVGAGLSGGLSLALRAIFETPAPFPAGDAWDTARVLALYAVVTALFAPATFWGLRRIDQAVAPRREGLSARP